MNTAPRTRRPKLTLAAVVGPLLFTVAWIILGFANTGYTLWGVHVARYNPIQQQISALGVGNTASYMNTTFILTGLLLIAGAIGTFSILGSEMTARARSWSLVLCILPGAGSIIDGIFTFEPPSPRPPPDNSPASPDSPNGSSSPKSCGGTRSSD
jgi:Protein of unknown function (DUF998)